MVRTATSAANCDLEAYTREGLPGFATDPLQFVAPNGSVAAFARNHDVWLRDLADGTERRLSQVGEEHFGYGALPGWGGKLALLRAGPEGPLTGASWSPDGTKLLIARTDERRVGFIRRRWDYFVRHLLGADPPAGYSLP